MQLLQSQSNKSNIGQSQRLHKLARRLQCRLRSSLAVPLQGIMAVHAPYLHTFNTASDVTRSSQPQIVQQTMMQTFTGMLYIFSAPHEGTTLSVMGR